MSGDPLARSLAIAAEISNEASAPFALVGGLALAAWNQPRATKDVDILVVLDEPGLAAFLDAAARYGFSADPTEIALFEPGGFFRLTPSCEDRALIDVLVADLEFGAETVARALEVTVGATTVRVATVEDVVLMKLVSFRPQDTVDVEALVDHWLERLDLPHLRRWADRLHVRGRLEAFLEPVNED